MVVWRTLTMSRPMLSTCDEIDSISLFHWSYRSLLLEQQPKFLSTRFRQ